MDQPDPAATPRILVVGAGAVGGYLGARLAAAGRDVTFLVRPTAADRLRANGLVLRDLPAGAEQRLAPRAVTPEDLTATVAADGPFDVVLVTVKAPGLDWAASALATPCLLAPGAAVVPLLNGMAQLDVLAAALAGVAPGALVGATVRIVASVDDDGAVVLHQPIHRVTLGALAERPPADDDAADADDAPVARAAAVLDVSGIDVLVTGDAVGELWNKWYFIVASGVLGVLTRGTVGQVVATPGGVDVVDAILAETAAVPAAAGHVVPAADLDFSRGFLTAPGSGFVSSLYRDVVAGRAGESEHIVGDFVARARRLGVATPLCDVALLQMRVVTADRPGTR